MARPLRIEFSGAVYHVTSRGNAQQKIFFNDRDRKIFLIILDRVVDRFNWLLHAYCLMNNHYHFIIETAEGNLSRGMRQLNGEYTQKFNWWHKRVGHLFQGRYKAILIDKDNYLLEVCRYVVLNPVRAGIVHDPGAWYWSSYLATLGMKRSLKCLTVNWILNQFGNERIAAQKSYYNFVKEGIGRESIWQQVRGQIILGSEQFVAKLQKILVQKEAIKEVPKVQRYVGRPSLNELFKDGKHRNLLDPVIMRAYKYGYPIQEIAEFLGVHYSTVSRALKRAESQNA